MAGVEGQVLGVRCRTHRWEVRAEMKSAVVQLKTKGKEKKTLKNEGTSQ